MSQNREASTSKRPRAHRTLLTGCGMTVALMLGACSGPVVPNHHDRNVTRTRVDSHGAAPTSSSAAEAQEPVTATADIDLSDYVIAPAHTIQ